MNIRFRRLYLNRMMYWIKERHKIHLARQAGKPWPWTDDPILQHNFFTNPYRENDKTTIWFANNLREAYMDEWHIIWVCAAFRWFNSIRTGEILMRNGLWDEWDHHVAIATLEHANQTGPVFGGAYIIKIENGKPKITSCCEQISKWWDAAYDHEDVISNCVTLQEAHRHIKQVKHLGGFMAYEIVSDLRHTRVLNHATDVNTWCFLGPGAKRGLVRLQGGTIHHRTKSDPVVGDPMRCCQYLRDYINERLPSSMPQFEMREVEHTLCEFDKYARIWLGTGNMKSKRKFGPR